MPVVTIFVCCLACDVIKKNVVYLGGLNHQRRLGNVDNHERS